MSRLDDVSRELLRIKHDMEQAEGKIDASRDLIAELGNTGLLTGRVFLGPSYEGPYSPGLGPQDSGQVVQAVLLIPEGFGVCYWDTNEFWELDNSPEGFEPRARLKFQPFEACSPAEKKFMRTFISEMLDELADAALVAASKLEPGPRIGADEYFARRLNEASAKQAK